MTQRNKSFLWIRRVIGVVFLVWGLPSLLPGLALLQVFGIHGLIWLMEPLIFVVVGLVLLLGGRKKRTKEEERDSSVPWRRRENAPQRSQRSEGRLSRFSARSRQEEREAETHDHIPSTALGTEGRLRQLETLRDAGLMTPEEYRAKRNEILQNAPSK